MREKEKWIIDAAMQLFAKKGFSSTSVQEIATASGISKGAFYLYFESKEALLLAIFRYYSQLIQQRIIEVEALQLDPREQFELQIAVQIEAIMNHKAFIIMHVRESSIPCNAEIAAFVYQMRTDSNAFFRTKLRQVYGTAVEPYLHDLTQLLHGLLGACYELLLMDHTELSTTRVAAYMTKRMDSLVSGLLDSQEEPLLQEELRLQSCGDVTAGGKAGREAERGVDRKRLLLQAVSEAADAAAKQGGSEHLAVTLDLLRQEMAQKAERLPLIEGMLHNLGAYPMLQGLRDEVRSYYKLQL